VPRPPIPRPGDAAPILVDDAVAPVSGEAVCEANMAVVSLQQQQIRHRLNRRFPTHNC
jgi:hypothetical protein